MKRYILIVIAALLFIEPASRLISEETEPESPGERAVTVKKIGSVEFVHITGGEFVMGQSDAGRTALINLLIAQNGKKYGKPIYDKWYSDERPPHRVRVRSFWIATYPITQKQFREVMDRNPSHFEGDNLPVESVTWHEAMAFCEKFSAAYGVTARLPYEAEWEYACRAGTRTIYYWGNRMDERYCWYMSRGGATTHPVGKKLPNAWGVYDMSGNVKEWCMDWHDNNYYSESPSENPQGPASGDQKVNRGGAWYSPERDLRSAHRDGFNPAHASNVIGFRIVICEDEAGE